jgi:hypothetical protein
LRSSSWAGKAGKSPLTFLHERGLERDLKKKCKILPCPPSQKEGVIRGHLCFSPFEKGGFKTSTIITSRRN